LLAALRNQITEGDERWRRCRRARSAVSACERRLLPA